MQSLMDLHLARPAGNCGETPVVHLDLHNNVSRTRQTNLEQLQPLARCAPLMPVRLRADRALVVVLVHPSHPQDRSRLPRQR